MSYKEAKKRGQVSGELVPSLSTSAAPMRRRRRRKVSQEEQDSSSIISQHQTTRSSRSKHTTDTRKSLKMSLNTNINLKLLIPLNLLLLLIGQMNQTNFISAKPNSNSNSNSNQQQMLQHVQARTELDKQLLRKPTNQDDGPNSSSNSKLISANSDHINSQAQMSLTTNTQNFQCPEQFGYYTDTKDCTKYYVCVFGEVLHESCTGGLRFSRELQTCDWPRNVDCPNQNNSTQSSTSSSSQSAASASTLTTSLPPTSTSPSTTTGGLVRAQLPPSKHELPDQSGADTDRMGGLSANNELKSSSALVFADEGSDPQQPSFDEAVSPVITPDGAVHLHDGSGGTFSLTPNHNRALSGQPQVSGLDSSHQPNVDVFVRPLMSQTSDSRSRPNNQNRANNDSNQKQTSRGQLQSQAVSNPDLSHFSSSDQPEEMSSDMGDPNSESIGSQADQESNEESNTSENPNANNSDIESSADEDSAERLGEIGANQPLGSNQQPQPSVYIPPVMAQPNARSGQLINTSRGRTQSLSSQSSQLLTINNRQVDPSRQTFRPIIVASTATQSNSGSNQNLQEANGASQGNYQNSQFLKPQAEQKQNGNTHQIHSSFSNDQNQKMQNLNSNSRSSINGNNQPRGQHQHQPQQVDNRRGQNANLTNILISSNNPRQSRMSASSFVGDQNQLANGMNLRANKFLASFNQQNSVPSNVNFNDSSKLIRLQTSQFGGSNLNDHNSDLLSGSHSVSPLQQNNNQQLVATFQPKFPTSNRSQNVLFSQQPFGLVGDSNGSNENTQSPAANENTRSMDGQLFRESNGDSSSGLNRQQIALNSASLQQPRRPRPPKRQQIPTGPLPRRQTSVNGQSNQQTFRPNTGRQLVDFDQPTTTSTSSSQSVSSGFSAAHETTLPILEGDEVLLGANPESASQLDGILPPPTTPSSPVTRAEANSINQQLPATVTSNFKQQSDRAGNSLARQSNSFPATTQPSAFVAAPSRSRFGQNNDQNNGNQNTRSHPQLELATSSGQGHRNDNFQSSTEQPQANGNEMVTNVNSNGHVDQQEPQFVASRYLNSAIDALEAGQPFGTVDYDFDILNDNSTERRNPTGAGSANAQGVANSNQSVRGSHQNRTSSSSGHPNANAARQRQQQSSFKVEDVDKTHLTNGQFSGDGQIGLAAGTRNGQQQQTAVGRSRVANQEAGVGLSGNGNSNSNLIGRQQVSGSGQFNQDFFEGSQGNGGSQQAASSQSQAGGQQQNSPTKKPRPTNKKITVNHEQAVANNRASTEPAKRPEALYSTPTALQTATKCDNRVCRLPDCKCGDTLIPGSLDSKVIPQVVLLTFDDAVNDLNWEIYEELFTNRVNPNGCPVLATFYVSHEWTDYGQVQTLYSRGHEMASHSVTHSFGEKFSKSQWLKEVNGQREILNMYGGVKLNDVRGMRAPFLQIGGNKMFEMLYDANFTYDSSMPIFENSPPLWPYTLDYQLAHECMITPCPTKSFPGVWEVGMTMWVDLRGGRCSMGDACSNPSDEDGVYEMLMKNFNRHYKSNRAPFGLFYHSAWFNTVHHRRGFLRFMATVNALSDVFFVTNWQMLQWMRQPTPMSEINTFEPWQCPAKNDRPPPCFHPSVCNVKSEHGTRFMKTCQPCPANQQYPWVSRAGDQGDQV